MKARTPSGPSTTQRENDVTSALTESGHERLRLPMELLGASFLPGRAHQVPTPEQRATLDAMLLVPEGSRRSNLDRLRRSPTTISARALRQALERLSEIEKLGMSDLDFSRIPPGRVDALNLMDLELAKLLTEADREGKAKRKKTLQTFDQAAVLLRDALLIVLDPTQEEPRACPRATLRTGISRGARQGRCLRGSDRAATRDASLRRTHLPLSIRPIVPA